MRISEVSQVAELTEILGREEMTKHLREAIVGEKLSHAYIFSGEPGTGKKTVAKIFAQTMLCEGIDKHMHKIGDAKQELAYACGICPSCISAMRGDHPDITIIRKEEGKTGISVDDIREKLVEDVSVRPYKGNYKIYIIEEAQELSVEAQSAMLKTLEEPPSYAVIMLLVTSPNMLLHTIRSRAEEIEVPVLSDDIVEKFLREAFEENSDIKEDDIKFAVAFADGKIGRGMAALSSDLFRKIKADVLNVVLNIKNMSLPEMTACVRKAEAYKDGVELDYYFELMILWFRDVLLFESTRDANGIIYKDRITDISKQAQTVTYEGLENITEAIQRAKQRIGANVSFDITMELLFTTICENMQG